MMKHLKNKKNHNNHIRRATVTLLAVSTCSVLTLTGCASGISGVIGSSDLTAQAAKADFSTQNIPSGTAGADFSGKQSASAQTVSTSSTSATVLDASELFSDRDLKQTADLSDAVYYTVSDGTDIHIAEEGVYVLTGTAKNVTIYVEADTEAKVQLVLDGLNLTNADFPCIYVTEADKVFVTTSSNSSLSVTGTFTQDGDTNTDGVIFSRSDLVLNGTATLTISSTDNGIVGKDDLKVTGGTYNITAASKAIEANDSIRIAGGTFNLTAGTDGLHAENDEDDTLGYVYISDGTFTISAGDDGIHGTSIVQIDGGTFDITAAEGIEGTYIRINDGNINIQASDDGINAAQKSNSYRPTIEFNGGTTTIVMGAGDTDGVDSNGDIYVNGGTINVTGNSTFDYDGTAEYNGGTIIVNGEQVDTIPNQMMGGGRGGFGGMNGNGGFGGNGEMNGNGGFGGNGEMNGNSGFDGNGEMNGNGGFNRKGDMNRNGGFNRF